MKHIKVENPTLSRGLITADVTFEGIGKIPFTCGAADDLPHGKLIYKELTEGKWGAVKAEVTAQTEVLNRRDVEIGAVNELRATQWIVDRHRDQVDLCVTPRLLPRQFRELLAYRQKLRDASKEANLSFGLPTRPIWLSRGFK